MRLLLRLDPDVKFLGVHTVPINRFDPELKCSFLNRQGGFSIVADITCAVAAVQRPASFALGLELRPTVMAGSCRHTANHRVGIAGVEWRIEHHLSRKFFGYNQDGSDYYKQ